MIVKFPEIIPWKYTKSDKDRLFELLEKQAMQIDALVAIVERICSKKSGPEMLNNRPENPSSRIR